MTGVIRGIPRTYSGVTFRSTIEADWAATLDDLGIEWVYEPKLFKLPSGARYLPDFWLPKITTWFEVKGGHNERIEKVREFAETLRHSPSCDRTPGGHVSRWMTSGNGERRPGRETSEVYEQVRSAPAGETEVTLRTCGVPTPSLRRRVAWPFRGLYEHADSTWEPLDDTPYYRADFDPLSSCVTLDCSCGGGDDYGVPYRRVVVGRAGVFESARGSVAMTLTGCADCGAYTFVPDGGFQRCRACGAGGHAWSQNSRVFQSGAAGPWSLTMARVERPEKTREAEVQGIRAPRGSQRVPTHPTTRRRRVYLAGKISRTDWRTAIVGWLPPGGEPGDQHPERWPTWQTEDGVILGGMADYVGPFYLTCHGDDPLEADHGFAGCCEEPPRDRIREFARRQCMEAIDFADIVFAWIEDTTAYGTLVELGYAAARGKRIVIAHPPVPAIDEHLWFALGLAKQGDRFVTEDPAAALRRVLTPWQPEAVA